MKSQSMKLRTGRDISVQPKEMYDKYKKLQGQILRKQMIAREAKRDLLK